MNFTEEQQLAIDKEGTNIIVSAGAGSGKTAVLTQRVIRKLKNGVDVDRLLVLTFTNEAASEMKNRIRDGIVKNNLLEQLDLIESAYITTFDSFALSLVKKYHYLLNITRDIKIIDNSVITIYKYKVLDKIFEEYYGKDDFDKLINDFCQKDDINVKEFIINISNKLDLLIDKESYLDNYLDENYSDIYIDKLINEYILLIKNKINELREIYNELLSYCNDNLTNKLDNWLKVLFDGNDYDDYILFKTMPSVKFIGLDEAGLELKNEFKEKLDDIKELLRFSDKDEIKQSILDTKVYIKVIIEIVKKLDFFVYEYKDKNQIFEFNDISHMAIRIVKEFPNIRDEIKNYFNEIMVDEYQDTSSIQEEFIKYIENNNVYMVGDIKQSIYRFRNANPYIFQNKYDNYGKNNGGIKIDLNKNFRSRNETIFNINEIFNLIMDNDIGNAEYLKEHNMVYWNKLYDNEDTGHSNYMDIYNYEMEDDDKYTKEEKELFIISEDIQDKIKNKYQIFDKKTSKLRDLKYSDICIITDRNKHLITYKKILEYHEIPSVIYMDEELTNDTTILVIKNLINLVVLVNQKVFDNKFRYLFTSVARSFIFNYSDNDIYHLLNDKTLYNDKIIAMCREIDINLPLADVINDILNTFNIYYKLTTLNDIEKNIIRINNLIDIGDNLSNLGYDILDFINYFDDTVKLGQVIKYSGNTVNENAVKIMNIHKSKGLEFSLCYFTGMHNKFTIKEVSSKNLISDKYGIIVPYFKDNELRDTIKKDLYVNDYFIEEISEKIRLFYVALTRAREKMIIVTSINQEKEKYMHLVPYEKRIKYRSFLDILNSLKLIDKYVINKSANYSDNYKKNIIRNISKEVSDIRIIDKNIDISYKRINNEHFSKKQLELLDRDVIKKMEYGTKIHEILEYADFYNLDNQYVIKLLKHIDNNYINVYHEYEFMYEEDNMVYNGVIDLMLEYDNYISIIDYKLKNISDKEYIKQLNGYKKYINKITNKDVIIYLYSIMDDNLVEVTNEK